MPQLPTKEAGTPKPARARRTATVQPGDVPASDLGANPDRDLDWPGEPDPSADDIPRRKGMTPSQGPAPTKPPKPAGDPDLKVVKTPDPWADFADEQEFINVLWMGNGGTGKTSALATMANLGPVLMISAESGLKKRALVKLEVKVDNIKIWPRAGEPLTFAGLDALFWRIKADLDDNPKAWAGVGWDSVTEIHKRLLKGAVSDSFDKGRTKADARGEEFERDPFFIEQNDYRTMTEQVRQLLIGFRDLPCHFGITALLRREKDDDGAVVYEPNVNPALQSDIFGWMDVVAVTQVADLDGHDEFSGLFRPTGKYLGKDRFHALPRRLADPTFERILGYIEETIDPETDEIQKAARARRRKTNIAAAEAEA